MKNLFVSAAAVLAILCVSCDPAPIEEPTKTLTATIVGAENGVLAIAAEGGSYTVTVKAENVEWTATLTGSENFSIEGAATGKADAEFTLAAVPNTAIESATGTLTVSAEGTETVTFTLNQDVAKIVLTPDKTAAERMNLHGKVNNISFCDNFIRDSSMDNITFDEAGNVTGFERTNHNDNRLIYTIAYDADGRLSKIICGEDSIVFGYGTHGEYVATNSLFEAISYSLVIEYPVWLPMFIKDLTSINAINTGEYAGTIVYEIAVNGADGKITVDKEDYGTMKFENGFTKESDCGTSAYDQKKEIYTIDYETGNVLEIAITDYYGEMAYKFNNDAINSMSAVESEMMPLDATYDDKLDIATCGDVTFAYEYDGQGNWTKRTASDDAVVERTIKYF